MKELSTETLHTVANALRKQAEANDRALDRYRGHTHLTALTAMKMQAREHEAHALQLARDEVAEALHERWSTEPFTPSQDARARAARALHEA